MANNLQYFDVEKGLEITPEGVAGTAIRVFVVTAAPGASGDTASATQGSLALDYSNGDLYYKNAAGSGTDKWKKVANTADIASDISWREPAKVHDDATATIPTGITWPATIDGVATVNIGDRVLFSAISGGGGPNVYIASGASPAGTYVEDMNDETAGDRLYVQEGTDHAGSVWTYNGTAWVLSEKATDEKELSYIRQFIGKTVLGDTSSSEPIYDATPANLNHIANTDPLVEAIRKLDSQLGDEIINGNFVTAGEDTNDAIMTLDGAIGDAGSQIAVSVPAAQTDYVVDSVAVEDAAIVEWLVYAKNGTNVRSWFVTATHDGDDTPTEAANTDRAVRTRLVIGSLTVSVGVTLSGGSGGEDINLVVTNTPAVDVKVLRRIVKF